MSRLALLSQAVERALRTRRPVLAFGGWHPVGSLPAFVARLVLVDVHRLGAVPLNPVITAAPYARADDMALERGVRASRVVASRQRARAARRNSGSQLTGDFYECDWEVPAQVEARDNPGVRLSLRSFIAVDRITAEGKLDLGSRPGLGQRARRGERLPQLRALPVRSSSAAAFKVLHRGDLTLINLSSARGAKTLGLVQSCLESLPSDRPALIVAECAAELSRFSTVPAMQQLGEALALAAPPSPGPLGVRLVGQARVQYEAQFEYAMPQDDLTDDEREVAGLARAAWRQRWHSIDSAHESGFLRQQFVAALSDLRRSRPASADRFNLFAQLLATSERDAATTAVDRLRVVTEAALSMAESAPRVLLVVGGVSDEVSARASLNNHRHGSVISTALSRQLARGNIATDSAIVCGYYGPATMDGVLRAQPRSIVWILDPVEAQFAAAELHRQAAVLHRLGLDPMANLLGRFDSVLRESSSGTRAASAESHSAWFRSDTPLERDPYASEDVLPRTEEVDAEADFLVVLTDGTRLRVSQGRRFDVLRSQSPHPLVVRASDIQEGDVILVVRSSYQETLSELLLDELDRTSLREEAKARETWVTVAQAAVEASGLNVDGVVRRLREAGVRANAQRVRSWLREDHEETTPRDWAQFLAFARAIGIGMADDEIRFFFSKIKRWRVEHRVRGRAVVRVVRNAYFGGLSPADAARIEDDWGLGVRDLIEGCRVEEVEGVIQLR